MLPIFEFSVDCFWAFESMFCSFDDTIQTHTVTSVGCFFFLFLTLPFVLASACNALYMTCGLCRGLCLWNLVWMLSTAA
jgi:hypothetical protein